MNHWLEKFTDLFHNPVIDENFITNQPPKDIIYEMMKAPIIDEIKKTVKELNTRMVPSYDGIPVEILIHGSNKACYRDSLSNITHSVECAFSSRLDRCHFNFIQRKQIQIRVRQLESYKPA